LELLDESERSGTEVGAPNVALAAMTYRGGALAADGSTAKEPRLPLTCTRQRGLMLTK
jgi:hypothetical protein